MTALLPIVDCHCHLADMRLADEVDSIIGSCRKNRVERILVNGTCPQDWQGAIMLASQYKLDAAIGLHPFNAEMWSSDIEKALCDCISSQYVRAIGEIGLDSFKDRNCHEMQKTAFLRQLEIAREAGLPVALHLRVPWQVFFDLIAKWHVTCIAGYCHNFTGSWETARRLLDLGLCLSFNTSVLNCIRAVKAVENMPLNCILTETDSPDMPFNGKNKRPWHASLVLGKLAELRQCTCLELSSAVLANYDSLFSKR